MARTPASDAQTLVKFTDPITDNHGKFRGQNANSSRPHCKVTPGPSRTGAKIRGRKRKAKKKGLKRKNKKRRNKDAADGGQSSPDV